MERYETGEEIQMDVCENMVADIVYNKGTGLEEVGDYRCKLFPLYLKPPCHYSAFDAKFIDRDYCTKRILRSE